MVDLREHMPLRGDDVLALLEAHDIQVTAQRVCIAEVFFARPQHLCAEELLQRAAAGDTHVSKATVYNTLRLFVDKNLVREVNTGADRVFYDSNARPHQHVYNEDTGMLTDVDVDDARVSVGYELPPGTVQTGVDVVIRVRQRRASD